MIKDRKKLIIVLVVFIIFVASSLAALTWLSTRGRLSIVMPFEGTKTIIVQTSDKKLEYTTEDGQFSKILPTNLYSVIVVAENKSSINSVSVGRFLSTTTINPEVELQYSREFVGDNPNSCAETISGQLITYPCSGSFANMALHVPATNTVPTYTKTVGGYANQRNDFLDTPGIGTIEAVIKNGDSLQVIVRSEEEDYKLHNLFIVSVADNSITYDFVRSISLLDEDLVYTFKKYPNGVIIYDYDVASIFVGSDYTNLKKLSIPSSLLMSGVSPNISRLNDQSIVLSVENLDKDFNDASQGQNSSKMYVIADNDIVVERTFSNSFSKVDACLVYVCALSKTGTFIILDTSLNTIGEYYTIEAFESTNNEIIFADKDYVYRLGGWPNSGSIVLALNDYGFGGLLATSEQVLVNLSTENKRHTITLGEPNDQQKIDELISPLFDNPFVNTLSVYKNMIFISPELGERVYDTVLGTYEYTSANKKAASDSINKTLQDTGILNSSYNIKINNL